MSKLIADLNHAFTCHEACIVIETVEPMEVIYEITAEIYRRNKEEEDVEKSAIVAIHDPIKGLCDSEGMPFTATPSSGQQDDDLAKLGITPQAQDVEDALTAVQFFLGSAEGRLNRTENDTSQPGDSSLQILMLVYADRALMPNGSDTNVHTELLAALTHLRDKGAQVNTSVILLVQPGIKLPAELAEYCAIIEHGIPQGDERQLIIDDLVQGVTFASNISEEMITKTVEVTSGLSRSATERCVAKSLTTYHALNYLSMQKFKGEQLAKQDLDFWSADLEDFKLWPIPGHEFNEYKDVTCLIEETHQMNQELPEGHVRTRVRYSDGSAIREHWLDSMPAEDFEAQFRPERNFYCLDNLIGQQGLKDYIRNGLRAGVPLRAALYGLGFVGVPGAGKSHTIKCVAGEYNKVVTSIDPGKLFSKWQGETDKNMSRLTTAVKSIGGILDIDEFQQFIPVGDDNSDSGTTKRLGGSLLTFMQEQREVLILACANDISFIPPQFLRSGRFNAWFLFGFPGREAKDAGWEMYRKRHDLEEQEIPTDENWTVGEIAGCCEMAEQQGISLVKAATKVPLCYRGTGKKKIDELFKWAEEAEILDAETGEKFVPLRKQKRAKASSSKATTRAPRRGVRKVD